MATQPDGTETEWKPGVCPWFVVSSLKWLAVKLQALSSRNGHGSALLPQSFTPTLGTVLGLSKPGRQGTGRRGAGVALIAIVIPGAEFLLCARPHSPFISNPAPHGQTWRGPWPAGLSRLSLGSWSARWARP